MTHPSLAVVAHRPWPLPNRRWTWRQSWRDLLFAHWPVPAQALRPLVPEPLAIQEHQGTSWIGLVPFRMTGGALYVFSRPQSSEVPRIEPLNVGEHFTNFTYAVRHRFTVAP